MTIELVVSPPARDRYSVRYARTLARPPHRQSAPDLARVLGAPTDDPAPAAPYVDEFDLLRRGDAWCALPPIEAAIVRVLLERGPRVVTRREIAARAWPAGMPAGRPVDGRLHRLRTRLAPLGIRIHSVRQRGLLLLVDPLPAT